MLAEFMDLPTHPLVVHAAVVFVPLLVLAAVLYAVAPGLRPRLGWVAGALAVVGPLAALLAMLSGRELEKTLIARGYGPTILDQVATHREYGDLAFWFSLALGAVTGLLMYTTGQRSRKWPTVIRLALPLLVVAFGAVTAVYVYLAGESGARAVWTGVL
jgi:uncharacterized membrane protein